MFRSASQTSELIKGSSRDQYRISDWILLVLVSLLAVLPAWFLGAYRPVVQVWMFAVICVAIFFAILRYVQGGRQFKVPVLFCPMLLALGLGAVQLFPFSHATRAVLSPVATEIRDSLQFTPDMVQDSSPELQAVVKDKEYLPLSLYPASTRRDLSLLVMATAALVLGAWVAGVRSASILVLSAIAVNGVVFSFFGIAQRISWNGLIYWQLPTNGGAPFAAFINRNNAGAFLNLCLAAAIGVLIWQIFRRKDDATDRDEYGYCHSDFGSMGWRIRSALVNTSPWVLANIFALIVIAGGVLCTLSRGSVVSLAISTIIVALIVGSRWAWTWIIWTFFAAASAGLLIYAGYLEALQSRFAETIDDRGRIANGRTDHWSDSLNTAQDFWQVGSGIGTYRFVYQRHESVSGGWFYHAENQYVEALVEGGVVGIGLLITAIVLSGMAIAVLLRRTVKIEDYALGVTGVFALSSQVVHACFDFALYAPANFVLFAIILGMVSARAMKYTENLKWRVPFVAVRFTVLPLSLLFLAAIWGLLDTKAAAGIDAAVRHSRVLLAAESRTEAELVESIGQLESALKRRPDDAEGERALANLWMTLYIENAVAELAQAFSGNVSSSILHQAASIPNLHARTYQLRQRGMDRELEQLQSQPVVRKYLQPALVHLMASIENCPVFPRVHLDQMHLSAVVPEVRGQTERVDAVVALAPTDAELLYRAGVIEFYKTDRPSAYKLWNRSLTHSSRYLDEILRVAQRELTTTELLEKVLPADRELLFRVAVNYFPEDSDQRNQVLGRIVQDFEEHPPKSADDFRLLAVVNQQLGRYSVAIKNLTQAVQISPFEQKWIFELAQLEWNHGSPANARGYLDRCLRMDQENKSYRAFWRELNSH